MNADDFTAGIDADDEPSIVETVNGRLNVEMRVLGLIAFVWACTVVQALGWAFIGLDRTRLVSLPWVSMCLPQLLAVVLILGTVYARMPTPRWRRRGSHVRLPSAIPGLIAGLAAVPFVPLLLLRDRRAGELTSEDVELAFRQLLDLPRAAGTAFLVFAGSAYVVDAFLVGTELGLARRSVVALAVLCIALIAPFSAIVTSRTRSMLRPELLTAPRSKPRAFPEHRDLRVRLFVPAAVAGFGAVVAPLLAGFLWSASLVRESAIDRAHEETETLADLVEKNDQVAVGRFLSDHPRHSVLIGERTYGAPVVEAPRLVGAIDSDQDGWPDRYVESRGEATIIAPIEGGAVVDPFVLILGAITGIVTVVGSAFLVTRDVARDVVRATEQVRVVADGDVPEPLSEASFSTRELRQLVFSVDRLVQRTTETNVAKYVVIEKAQEADRLKSQFLANMSHDLRSPLNSILGFSELLLTGIDGDLKSDQCEMVETIQASGRELLQQIDDILDTAKIEAGRMEMHPEPTPPSTLVTRAIQAAKQRQDEPLEFEIEQAAGLPPAFVDPYRTTQAVENVFVFAGERVRGGGTLNVKIGMETVDGERMVMIQVTTPTRPASASQLQQALRGFVRIPGHRGLGLALPIAASIAELSGGSLTIDDSGHQWQSESENQGDEPMTFTLHLPAPESRRRLSLRER